KRSIPLYLVIFLFFFSSRRRHTRFSRDWSSDVCSSDLINVTAEFLIGRHIDANDPILQDGERFIALVKETFETLIPIYKLSYSRSEERRVGKECRSWCMRYDNEKMRYKIDNIRSRTHMH